MPHQFVEAFGKNVDCFDILIERPSNLKAKAQTFSHYKHNRRVVLSSEDKSLAVGVLKNFSVTLHVTVRADLMAEITVLGTPAHLNNSIECVRLATFYSAFQKDRYAPLKWCRRCITSGIF